MIFTRKEESLDKFIKGLFTFSFLSTMIWYVEMR